MKIEIQKKYMTMSLIAGLAVYLLHFILVYTPPTGFMVATFYSTQDKVNDTILAFICTILSLCIVHLAKIIRKIFCYLCLPFITLLLCICIQEPFSSLQDMGYLLIFVFMRYILSDLWLMSLAYTVSDVILVFLHKDRP